MEIQGVVRCISEETQVSDKFTKRELCLEVSSRTPQVISIEFVQGFCSRLDTVSVGDKVVVGFELMGREYKGKVYNTIRGVTIAAV